jgi:hypothetical protein
MAQFGTEFMFIRFILGVGPSTLIIPFTEPAVEASTGILFAFPDVAVSSALEILEAFSC